MWRPTSDAAGKTATSSAPAAMAACIRMRHGSSQPALHALSLARAFVQILPTSRPFIFGVKTGYRTPALFLKLFITSAASASWGTHFGETKLVASMVRSPASAKVSMRATCRGQTRNM